jgi:hypothetical protein
MSCLCHRCYNVLVRRAEATLLGVHRTAPSRLSRTVPLALALSLSLVAIASSRHDRHLRFTSGPGCHGGELQSDDRCSCCGTEKEGPQAIELIGRPNGSWWASIWRLASHRQIVQSSLALASWFLTTMGRS